MRRRNLAELVVCLLALGALGGSGCEWRARAGAGCRVAPMVRLAGGPFRMGTDGGFPFEGPARAATVEPFWIDAHEVTAAEFAEFVVATGYVTDAELYGWSLVFSPREAAWLRVDAADWRRPDGPGTRPLDGEPVTQVSWRDAAEYARWAGKRLPTEAEWEFAARGGLGGAAYAWGDEPPSRAGRVANVWQGEFPAADTAEDGFAGRAPVCGFPPNGYGLCDMTGNVWEWCADMFDEPAGSADARAIRGGSWLCAENACRGYRVAARSHAPPDSGMNNLGFRCARDGAKGGR